MKLFTLYADLQLVAEGFRLGIEDAKKDMEAMQKEMTNTEKSAKKTGKQLENAFGHALGDILSGITQAAIETAFTFVEEGVELASSMEEITNVVNTTFGDASASRINAWARTTKESYGIGALSAKEYASTMGSTLKGLGIYEDQLYDMSTSLVGLAGDMASFRNLKTEDSFRKIMSGITGEMEPLKELGIIMSATNLAAHAAVMGITDDWSKLDSATQTLVRYDYLMQQTSNMHGDFAKTSESYSNQMRLLQENIEQLKLSVGESLLPVMTKLVGWFNALFGSEETASESMEDFTNGIIASFTDISETTTDALSLINALDELSASTEDAASTEKWTAILNNLKQTLPGIGDLIDAETGRIEGGTEALRNYAERWESIQHQMAVSAALDEYRKLSAEQATVVAELESDLYYEEKRLQASEAAIAEIYAEAREYLGVGEDVEVGRYGALIAEEAAKGNLQAQIHLYELQRYAEAPERVSELERQLAFAEAELAEVNARYVTMQEQVERLMIAAGEYEGPVTAREVYEEKPDVIETAAALVANAAPVVNVAVSLDGQELAAIVTAEVERQLSRNVSTKSR